MASFPRGSVGTMQEHLRQVFGGSDRLRAEKKGNRSTVMP